MWGSAWRRLRSWQVMTAWRRRGGTANRPSRISNKWWSSSVRKSRNSPSAYPSRMLWPLLHESLCNPVNGQLIKRLPDRLTDKGEEQTQGIAIAQLGIAGQITFVDDILE